MQNFVACDREQVLLLPPSLREWLPEGHLAWFVIDAVAAFDLSGFYAAYRADGHGRPAHDPAMMVALLLYGYAIGERSSRRLERRCVEDVATRVICANQAPDHTTIARFRQRHEAALAELFGDVLELCAEAGLLRVGVIAVDGTKLAASAAPQATRDYAQIAARFSMRPTPSMPPKTPSSARRAARCCRRSCRPRRAGAAGCAKRRGGWMTSAPPRRGRSRVSAVSACARPS